MLSGKRVSVVLWTCSLLLVVGNLPAAGKKTTKTDPGQSAVENAQRAEVAGAVDRRERLAGALRELPESSLVRWQAGFVRDGKTWRSFDEIPAAPPNSAVKSAYAARRREAAATLAGQMDLANWCRKQGLADQERAHLWAALESASGADQSAVLGRLGFLPVGHEWLTRADLARWHALNNQVFGSIKRWGPKLEKLAKQLDGTAGERDAAARSISQLSDADVIPALEYLMCGNESSAHPAVAAFAGMTEFEATIALARQAVFSKWPKIRRQAAEALKARPLDDFVPGLIACTASLISTSQASGWAYLCERDGRGQEWGVYVLLHSYLVARETDDQFQVSVLNTADYRISEWLRNKTVHFHHQGDNVNSIGGPLLTLGLRTRQNELNRDHADYQHQIEVLIAEQNERTVELNLRIIDVLAAVSGREPSPDLKGWWRWWESVADTQRTGEKPAVVLVSEEEIGDPTLRFSRVSCFAAGTPVWTDQGPMAIETIRIGDRVLTQNVETGELAYKPVLKTTVRPPKELTTLRLADESIVCTGGHKFWNSGSGWIRARDLNAQALLHTVTGNTPVWLAKKGETAETYNLVVDDFHTYFVGKAGVLCQDLLPPKRTNSIVPGLLPKNAVARAGKSD